MKVISETLHNLAISINATKDWEDKAPTHIHSHGILNLLADRVEYLKSKVEQADKNFTLHPIHLKSKRGLLDVVGKASKFLFGTATEDDIHDLREHYNHIFSFAAKNRRVINLNYKKIVRPY